VSGVLKAHLVPAAQAVEREANLALLAVEKERQDAIAAAYAAGMDAGRDAALAASAAAGPRIAEALEQLAASARQHQVEAVDTTSRAVLASAIDIAEWILRHELPTDSRSLLARLGEAASALLPSPTARVVVGPADEPAVREWASMRDVELVVDPALAPGDARYDNGTGSVEVTVAAALRIAAEALGIDPARGVR
jgi:flagellar assembly protein FliH